MVKEEGIKFINIRLKPSLLEELNLPDIDYAIPMELFSESLDADKLPLSPMLFGLQNIENVTDNIIMAKSRLAHILSPDDNRDIITACGDSWWLELGPIDMSNEMVTIQQSNNLIGVIQSREDGRLRIATYKMLDKKSLYVD